MSQTLFTTVVTYDYFERRKKKVKSHIDEIRENVFLNSNISELNQYLIEEYEIMPLILRLDDIEYVDRGEVDLPKSDFGRRITVKGFRLDAHIPYEGNKMLFNFIPMERRVPSIEVEVNDNEIVLSHNFTPDERENIKRTFQKDIDNIQFNLSSLKRTVDEYNTALPALIEETINARKARLKMNSDIIESLGIPLKKTEQTVREIQIPTTRRQLTQKNFPNKANQAVNTEYHLPDNEYEYILNVLRNMTLVMERTPKVFTEFDEESIRDMFLVILNGHYEGKASGETFNNEGKTDILIRHNGRNAFIAECKFWGGAQQFISTLNQLTERYLTWRDTKAAVLIFNRNKDFTSVIRQIPDLCRKHYSYIKDGKNASDETEFRFVAKHKEDSERHIDIAIMAFNVPS